MHKSQVPTRMGHKHVTNNDTGGEKEKGQASDGIYLHSFCQPQKARIQNTEVNSHGSQPKLTVKISHRKHKTKKKK